MQFTKTIFLTLVALLLASCSNPDAIDSKGREIHLSDYQGKWIYINYWATWCKPCIEELPALDAFHKNNTENVVVLGVNFDNLSHQDIEDFIQKVPVDFPLLSALPQKSFDLPAPTTLPTTYIINPKGELVETLHGPQTLASLQQALTNLV